MEITHQLSLALPTLDHPHYDSANIQVKRPSNASTNYAVGIGNHARSLVVTGQTKSPTRACGARPFHSSRTFSFVSTLYEYIARAMYLIVHPIPVSGSLLRSSYSFYIVFTLLVYKSFSRSRTPQFVVPARRLR